MYVVGIVDAERRLHDRQLNDEFDARGTPEPEICSRGDREFGVQLRCRELTSQAERWSYAAAVIQRGGIQLQSTAVRNAAGTTIKKERRLEVLLHDGDAIFHVSEGLSIATWKRCRVNESRNGERTRAGAD